MINYRDSQKEKPQAQPPAPIKKISVEDLSDDQLDPNGVYSVIALKHDVVIPQLGTIPAHTRGIGRWPNGADTTRVIEFHFPNSVIMSPFKLNNFRTVPTTDVYFVGRVNL